MALQLKTPSITKTFKQNGTESYPKYNGQNVTKIQVKQNNVVNVVWEHKKVVKTGSITNYTGYFQVKTSSPGSQEWSFTINNADFANKYSPLLTKIKGKISFWHQITNSRMEIYVDISSTEPTGSLPANYKGYSDDGGVIRYIHFSAMTSLNNGGEVVVFVLNDKTNYGHIFDPTGNNWFYIENLEYVCYSPD